MAVYKIPQDVEADDKFVGPLSFKQFIFVGIAVVAAYLSFISLTKGFWPAVIFLFPFMLVGGFLGFPWGRDQPTEIWLAARIRFFIKPRVRIWNQSGAKELVTITAPKKIEKSYTDGLSNNEVNSRLSGLATLLDSRGWAVKNMTTGTYTSPVLGQNNDGDRLLDVGTMPQQVTDNIAAADVLDESNNTTALNFDHLIKNSEDKHRQDLMQKMQSVRDQPVMQPQTAAPQADFWYLQNQAGQQQATAQPAQQAQPTPQQNADFWFLQQGAGAGQPAQQASSPATQQQQAPAMPAFTTFQTPAVVAPHSTGDAAMAVPQQYNQPTTTPNIDEAALLEKIHRQQNESVQQYGHLKTIRPLSEQTVAAPTPQIEPQIPYNPPVQQTQPAAQVTAPVDTAIINLANNDDLNIATLARQAHKAQEHLDDGEVVISLH